MIKCSVTTVKPTVDQSLHQLVTLPALPTLPPTTPIPLLVIPMTVSPQTLACHTLTHGFRRQWSLYACHAMITHLQYEEINDFCSRGWQLVLNAPCFLINSGHHTLLALLIGCPFPVQNLVPQLASFPIQSTMPPAFSPMLPAASMAALQLPAIQTSVTQSNSMGLLCMLQQCLVLLISTEIGYIKDS